MSNANKISQIKDPIRTLRKIQTVRPDAIIAGGYHRDMLNDIGYHDVDIYVPYLYDGSPFDPTESSSWEKLLELNTNDFRSMDMIQQLGDTDEAYNVADSANINTVFGLIKNEIQYNIIVVLIDPIEFVEQDFDFNICKTYCDGKKVTFTKEFMGDMEHNRLTFSERKITIAQFTHAMNVHYPKLKHKYPTHTLVIPSVHDKIHNLYKSNQ